MTRRLGYLCLFLLLALGAPGVTVAPAVAQASREVVEPDYIAWEDLAAEAEETIEAAEISDAGFEELRALLVGWRQQFVDMQGVNATAIRTVQDQLAALGPVPESGEEPADIATQRADLETRLLRLQAPARVAELARSRADALIAGVDGAIRARQKEELLRLGPSPLNPLHWDDGATALFRGLDSLRLELATSWRSEETRGTVRDRLPAMLVLGLFGLVLLARGRRWSARLAGRILSNGVSAGRWIAAFLVSLGEWFLPFVGFLLLIIGFSLSGMLGERGQLVSGALGTAVFIFLSARWLTLRILPRNEMLQPMLRLEAKDRSAGRLYGAILGLVVAAFYFLQDVADGLDWSEEARNVVLFPVMLLSSLLAMRLARLLLRHSLALDDSSEAEAGFRNTLTRVLARGLWVLAVASPLLAAVGYVSAAQAMILPTLLSLMLMAALLVLQRVLTEVYVLLSGNREGAADALVPVLASFLLMLVSLPFFALIWGARPAQLEDLWLRFTEGVSLGGISLSPTGLLTLAAVFTLGYLATRLVQGALRTTLLPRTKLDVGGRNAIVSGVGYVGIFFAALAAVTSAGIDLSSLAIVAGALSVGIGFGLQNIVSNFVSGIILLIERPISEGDWVEVGGQQGYVRSISVRSTRIETFDRTDVIVPNADFVSGMVTNYTRGNTVGRVIVPVGVAYGTDTRRVETILREIAEAHPMVLMNPRPAVIFQRFGASSLDFEIRAILRDVNWVLSVKSDMNHEIARRFAEEGIEIPFPQQDVWVRNPEALAATAGMGPAAGLERPAGAGSAAHLTEADLEASEGDAEGDGR